MGHMISVANTKLYYFREKINSYGQYMNECDCVPIKFNLWTQKSVFQIIFKSHKTSYSNFFQLLEKVQLADYRKAGCGPESISWPCIKPKYCQSEGIKGTAVSNKARLWPFSGATDSGGLLGPSPHSRLGEVSHFVFSLKLGPISTLIYS